MGAILSKCRRSRSASPPTQLPSVSTRYRRSRSHSPEKVNLSIPEDLKAYSASVEVVCHFWSAEVETLSEEEYTQIAVLLFDNVLKLVPAALTLLGGNIELSAQKFFRMFQWLMDCFQRPDVEQTMDKITVLGTMHTTLGIKPEYYALCLQAFHETMHERIQRKYTSRVRLCMEQLYTAVSNIMLQQDFQNLTSPKISKLMQSLTSLQACLEDEDTRIYLELYMREMFCVELFLFYQDYITFRACASEDHRQQIGAHVMEMYIDDSSDNAINLSHRAKRSIYDRLEEKDGVFQADVFDECVTEILELIDQGVWNSFKRAIGNLAVLHS
mmetsp:Transcript_68512/g.108809  ORF Transcript_68512/g.108809 Transcript_68512/m.108809 type:complete len:328 (-) Transcript_68512:147-1130(-)